jgi:dihydroorotate dehydrogenase
MYTHLRPLLFKLDPEGVHTATIGLLRLVGALPPIRGLLRAAFSAHSPRSINLLGLKFSNPVGLAAGYDKDGNAWSGLSCLGFGHIEVGTVTPLPQKGNPKPRIFRLPEDMALINRMGFPGRGADYVLSQLQRKRSEGLVLGVNIGKNKETPNEDAAKDYLGLIRLFAPHCDYLVVNVSSPNTIGLRRLQARQALEGLLSEVASEKDEQSQLKGRPVPILVKIAPDLSDLELDDALDVITRTGMDGVIATNTTIGREGVTSHLHKENGGISGAPLRLRSTEMVRKIYDRTAGRLVIIGVGGIRTPAHAKEKLDAGASLVQVYTGLIYAGPGLVKEIVNELISCSV